MRNIVTFPLFLAPEKGIGLGHKISHFATPTEMSTRAPGGISFRQSALILLLAITCNGILAARLPTKSVCGAEAAGIASSIAEGRGFSSPYLQRSGPSAWLPPVYPYVLALIFRLFGVFTLASYRVAIGFNILVHALTCVLLYRAAAQAFGERVGYISGYGLAILPLLSYPLVLLHLLPGNAGAERGLFILPTSIWYNYLSGIRDRISHFSYAKPSPLEYLRN